MQYLKLVVSKKIKEVSLVFARMILDNQEYLHSINLNESFQIIYNFILFDDESNFKVHDAI